MLTKQCGSAATHAIRRLILAAAVLSGLALSGASFAADDGESNKLIKNSYQQTLNAPCTALNVCAIVFPAMTDAKTVITAVSCTAFVTPGSFVGFRLINGASNGVVSQASPIVYLPAFVYAQEGAGFLQVAMNATTNLFFDKGDSAQVDADVSNGGNLLTFQQMSCTISGYHS
jgi:hypothetical protein